MRQKIYKNVGKAEAKNVQEAKYKVDQARRARADSLDLSGLGLSSLPANVWDLSQLESLFLQNNLLRALPHEIGRLNRLRELNLDRNDLESLPETVSQLINLKKLSVSRNRLTSLPKALGNLSSLEYLTLQDNRLKQLPASLGSLRKLVELDVTDNALEMLPPFTNCHQLARLFLSRNPLKHLPDSIGTLRSLRSLCASSIQLDSVPASLYSLINLQYLALSNNPLQSLPLGIERLKSLRGLTLATSPSVTSWSPTGQTWVSSSAARSRLLSLPRGLQSLEALRELYLHGQTQLFLPPEVLGPAWEEVYETVEASNPVSPAILLAYYYRTHGESATNRPLNEAKMILVGRGGVGKTSLVNHLVHNTYDPHESKTDGISITPWTFAIRNEDIKLNIWDFGGQEIMHSTHQFFLTKRSLYLLVLNAREGEQDANVEYWLRLIESFGGNSPVIVVTNKVKEHLLDLNRRGLKDKFPTIKQFVQTDCAAAIGISELRAAVVRETDLLEHLRDPFPAAWFAVKERLANLKVHEEKDFIPFSRYQALCLQHGIEEAIGQETLVGFLHDLGIVVNFRDDPRLSEMHVLNPEWVTNGIYKILNADKLAQRRGELNLTDLSTILNKQSYPPNMHLFLLDLMRKFELCYEFYGHAGYYLVPELLGKEEPDLGKWNLRDSLRFDYRYNILPEGLLPRFIVRSKALNRSQIRWRTGAVLEWEGNTAIVKADPQGRHVSIVVVGPTEGRRRLLAVVRADLEHIHASIPRLQARGEVPLVDHSGLAVDYQTLFVLEGAGDNEYKVVHDGKVVTVYVRDLLRGVDEARRTRDGVRSVERRETVRVAFSYSHKDEELRDQLETHLKLLQRQGLIASWHDRRISPGDGWRNVIEENFLQADLILLLVSADFLASDYCYETEMKTALARHKQGDTRVVPVVLRACDWTTAPFSGLQALPKDATPVTSWSNRDEAWNDVARGLRGLVDEILGRASARQA